MPQIKIIVPERELSIKYEMSVDHRKIKTKVIA